MTCTGNEWGWSPLVEPLQKVDMHRYAQSPISSHTVSSVLFPTSYACVSCHKINYVSLCLKSMLCCCRVRKAKNDALFPPDVWPPCLWLLFTHTDAQIQHNLAISLFVVWKTAVITSYRCFAITTVTPGRRMCFCTAAVWRKPCGSLDLPLTRSPWKKTRDTGYA